MPAIAWAVQEAHEQLLLRIDHADRSRDEVKLWPSPLH